jgi:hypothetical protein
VRSDRMGRAGLPRWAPLLRAFAAVSVSAPTGCGAGEIKAKAGTFIYKNVVWPVFAQLGAEQSHNLAVMSTSWGLTPFDRVPDDPVLNTTVFGMDMRARPLPPPPPRALPTVRCTCRWVPSPNAAARGGRPPLASSGPGEARALRRDKLPRPRSFRRRPCAPRPGRSARRPESAPPPTSHAQVIRSVWRRAATRTAWGSATSSRWASALSRSGL